MVLHRQPSKIVVRRPLPSHSSTSTSRPRCQEGGPPTSLVQLAPGALSQVVLSPAAWYLAALRCSDAAVKKLDPIAFQVLSSGFFLKMFLDWIIISFFFWSLYTFSLK
jgi:hypothetical protein